MNFKLMIRKLRVLFVWIAALTLLASCQSKAETAKITDLKKQVEANEKVLDNLESQNFVQLEKDFISCDSMLQYMSQEEVDTVFEQLRLVGAYITQFKLEVPVMRSRIDYSLSQLDKLKADAESHYFSDSLVFVYLADEARSIDTLTAQIDYFKDRFAKSQKFLDDFKKKK